MNSNKRATRIREVEAAAGFRVEGGKVCFLNEDGSVRNVHPATKPTKVLWKLLMAPESQWGTPTSLREVARG